MPTVFIHTFFLQYIIVSLDVCVIIMKNSNLFSFVRHPKLTLSYKSNIFDISITNTDGSKDVEYYISVDGADVSDIPDAVHHIRTNILTRNIGTRTQKNMNNICIRVDENATIKVLEGILIGIVLELTTESLNSVINTILRCASDKTKKKLLCYEYIRPKHIRNITSHNVEFIDELYRQHGAKSYTLQICDQ